ncbi:hypothetical protein RG836_11425 [Pseudomonas sp. SZMC_28357]|uniref:hypothetical protein n=1 Tax=Pseudomonas sp. SZMC_28357 TaxID=3074380 RepID=UPI00287203D6|nr:hypothetical protein [Pseudomonas sp. SZMC_28357]MDR9752060.1 hypothetical protein [Pseudomonas sp. SZMC_28357]
MAFQFMHVDSFSRSTPKTGKTGGHSVRSIIAEANREPDAIPHIDEPQVPTLLFGKPIEELEATCEAWAAGTTDALGRKVRKDALCLLGGVFSAPGGTDPAAWEKIKGDALDWLQGRYGDRLQAVLEHKDESHPHCHFYIVPRPGESFDAIHDGRRAASELGKGVKKGERNKAYIAAMRSFQDSYYDAVGAPNGMTRIGPARRRLTREEWKLEQLQAEAVGAKMEQANAIMDHAQDHLKSAQVDVTALKAEALAEARAINEKALKAADTAHAEAIREGLERGTKEFEKSSIWSKVSGFLAASVRERDALKKEVEKLTVEQAETKGLLARIKAAGRSVGAKYKTLERKLDNVVQQLKITERERNHLRAEMKELKERDRQYAGFDKQLSDIAWERDGERARADQILRQLSKLEESHKVQDVPTAPSTRFANVELGQTV